MDFADLARLAGGHSEARAIQVALKLGLFETLAQEPRDAAALASAVRTEPRATRLLVDALVALGLLELDQGRYTLARVSRRHLVQSSDEYLGGMILFDESLFSLWGDLEKSIRTGRPARAPDMFQTVSGDTERFIRAMDSLVRARGDARWVAEHLDLSNIATIADLGGGPGTYIAEMLRRWPALRGSIYDLPATLEVARRVIAERAQDVAERIDLVSVDYLADDLPGPIDALFMSNIVHSEDERTNELLMSKCFRALASGGTIIVKDHVMNAELTEPVAGAIFSLYLLLTTRGRDYSVVEISSWLESAGFVNIRLESLPSPPFTSSMVLAQKP